MCKTSPRRPVLKTMQLFTSVNVKSRCGVARRANHSASPSVVSITNYKYLHFLLITVQMFDILVENLVPVL